MQAARVRAKWRKWSRQNGTLGSINQAFPHRGYYWVYQNSIDKLAFFDYQEGRGREGPTGMLENFNGYLQTDGYVAYDVFDKKENITLIHCMAHARRMFHEALRQ